MPIKKPINEAHQNLFNAFGTVAHAARILDIDRLTIMAILKGGGSERTRRIIKSRGYDPDTFLPIKKIPL